jgi:hypothetical protein
MISLRKTTKFFPHGLHAKGKGLHADGAWILDPGTTAEIETLNGCEWFVVWALRSGKEIKIAVSAP